MTAQNGNHVPARAVYVHYGRIVMFVRHIRRNAPYTDSHGTDENPSIVSGKRFGHQLRNGRDAGNILRAVGKIRADGKNLFLSR